MGVSARRFTVAALVGAVLMGGGCAALNGRDAAEAAARRMDAYAVTRYENAMRYMEAGRYELAMDQFAAAVATARTPEMRRLAEEGYAKAGRTIAARR